MPCKDMLVLMENVEHVTWFSLSKEYRDSPFLKLDEPLLVEENDVFTKTKPSLDTNFVDNVELKKLSKKQYEESSKGTICREMLNQIKHLTYLIYDN